MKKIEIIALKADTGKYLSRINRGTDLDPIEAAKDRIDAYSKFFVTQQPNGKFVFKPGASNWYKFRLSSKSLSRYSPNL